MMVAPALLLTTFDVCEFDILLFPNVKTRLAGSDEDLIRGRSDEFLNPLSKLGLCDLAVTDDPRLDFLRAKKSANGTDEDLFATILSPVKEFIG